MRLFVAITLPQTLVDDLVSIGMAIRTAEPGWAQEKWVAPEALHMTLKFIGDLPEAVLPEASERVLAALAGHAPFVMPMSGVRAVPRPRRASMLWAAFLDPDGACASLAFAIDRACVPLGVEPDVRAFTPHVTLCRARRPRPVRADTLDDAAARALSGPHNSMSVVSVTLFSSRLTSKAPEYLTLAQWPLGSA